MKSKLLEDRDGARVWGTVFDAGDEVMAGLLEFACSAHLTPAAFTGVGAFQTVTLGYFDIDRKRYLHIPLNEQVEVVSLVGNITRNGDQPKVHAHVVVAKSDGSAHGGHLIKALVRPTLEIMLTETPAHLSRRHDPESGLALIDLDAP